MKVSFSFLQFLVAQEANDLINKGEGAPLAPIYHKLIILGGTIEHASTVCAVRPIDYNFRTELEAQD